MADNIIYETNRNTKTARTAQNPCSEVIAGWLRDSRNCSNDRSIPKLCGSVEGCLQKRRSKSTGKQTTSVKAMQAVRQTTFKASKASFKRPKSKWLQNRLVDFAAYRKIDTQTFWYKLPFLARLATPAKDRLELPETREARQRTQRAGNSQLAKEGLASYKKKHIKPAEPLYWSMKAVSCCNLQFGVLGHLRDKLPFNIAGIEETDSRQFLRSVSLRCITDLVCISLFRTAISAWMILKCLYRCCWNIFRRVLSLFSTAGWFTVGRKGDCVRGLPNVLTLNGFRHMLLSLIRSSRYGITASTANWPIIFPMTYWHLKKPFLNLSTTFIQKNTCYAHSSKRPGSVYNLFH